MSDQNETDEPIGRLTKDLKEAVKSFSQDEVRYLVKAYYTMQDNRIRAAHQSRTLEQEGEPHKVINWFQANSKRLEDQVALALKHFAQSKELGRWCMEIKGVGPVISAGLLAHIQLEPPPNTVGKIWRFAGLDPTVEWKKGQKRPWNAELKTLCAFKLGECFVKVSGKDDAYYGKLYAERKVELQRQNEALAFQEDASKQAENVGKNTVAYTYYAKGMLPPAHVHARARRFTVKIFLSHLHEQAFRRWWNEEPPAPYAIAHLGHVDKI